MANRILKCYFCGEKDREDKIEVEYGKQKRRYHTKNCYDLYLKDQEFKKKEKQELDELVETIKEVHGIEIIPNQFFSYLQDIRNGNELFGRIGEKKNKDGYTYECIRRTYEFCKDDINWALNNRNFNGTLQLLRYTIAIIKNKIAVVNYQIENEKKQLEEQQRQLEVVKDYIDDEWTFNNEKNNNDISDLLD